eukprot:CAMPEP_0203958476 /NCGR_PEP_ID=MMETSP0359-20131031/89922_1 /ASSEMBLY_ACC=CAM_ASM_000338 /TAXON_ID=268821 /ORGANISM="Scrippsiella Hangoei, Strain SHTV-5" /LENGTH=79 /DNA_ID=CAMNT_0050892447 /DNA_START=14 /DNA_END=250 /DNA_ORIENTATION=+
MQRTDPGTPVGDTRAPSQLAAPRPRHNKSGRMRIKRRKARAGGRTGARAGERAGMRGGTRAREKSRLNSRTLRSKRRQV